METISEQAESKGVIHKSLRGGKANEQRRLM